jgi:mono/diheme cytochrome c family protein
MEFERRLPTEEADTAEIVRDILIIQARYASKQHRPLGRGTHTKGICARATFEIFDAAQLGVDAEIAARLAKGVFARPGVYQATVRFANGASQIYADSKPDVRALSFAVEFPAGVAGPEPFRHDFSMNNATTFPINDPHAFASFMKVAAADGVAAGLKRFFSLPFSDMWGIVQTAARGVRQKRTPLRPYQQTRYWSNVPFLHGRENAVKYSAIPHAGNPGQPVRKGPTVLRDELIRHLNEDPQMAAFDFGVQFLDAARMKWRGSLQEPSFWVENASKEWPEAQAPFHVVGRLTLTRASQMTTEDCSAQYIDVTEHSTPESRPIGGINRARWFAESASRKMRLGGEAVVSAPAGNAAALANGTHPVPVAGSGAETGVPALRTRIGNITLRTLFRGAVAAVLVVFALAGMLAVTTAVYTSTDWAMLPPEHVDRVVYPDQGWGAGLESPGRQAYYYTPQGAVIKDMRYSWFINLEMPLSYQRFADPEVLRRYGFLVDPETEKNPARLPVGFTKHLDRGLGEELLDITCAACHTGQLNVTRNGRTTAVRIDGGSALHAFTDANFGHFMPTLVSSMVSTLMNPVKFNRFARGVLGEQYPRGRGALRVQFVAVLSRLMAMGFNEKVHHLVPTEEGYGRTDALTRISNTVFAEHLDAANYEVGNAPVNYPAVWNIWKFDWVQYNASVSQPMARNIGESMGTGAKYALMNRYGGPLLPEERFRSSSLVQNLHAIELRLRTLQPPAWPDSFGAIDQAKAEEGKRLFAKRCEHCHGPFNAPPALKARLAPLKTESDPEWIVRTVCTGDIGTDPNTAENFARATVDLTRTGLTAMDLRAVARRPLQMAKERQALYLTSEIGRMKKEPPTPESAKSLASLQATLDGLDTEMEQTLSQIDPRRVPVGAALSYVGTMIRERAYADLGFTPAQQADHDGFGILDLPQVINAYKPRPLAGMWATPPFLHNGSVPTIYDLLSPVEERPKTFRVGSREYDTVKLGLAQPASGFWLFDTTKDGNHNTGHEFSKAFQDTEPYARPLNGHIGPYLTPEERLAIIEHLKVRNDDRDAPQGKLPPFSRCPPPPSRPQ